MDPNNQSTAANPVGRFMVAVGAVIEQANTGKILLIQRNRNLDWQPNEWEIGYGRIGQFESTEQGLRREIKEELGITDIEILRLIRVWHMFRGSEKPENELIGITYHCKTNQEAIVLSDEHQSYIWVHPDEAVNMIGIEGIRKDVEIFIHGR